MFRALTLGTDLAFSPQDLAGKHPVSALTELCSKRRCLRHCLPSSIMIFFTRFINFFARVAIPVSKFFCRRWGPPIFTQAFECGPPHKKQYIIKVGTLKKAAVLSRTNQGERQRNRVHGQRRGKRQEEGESQRSHVLPSDDGTCP